MSIVRGNTLIDNTVSQINIYVGTLKFETKTILGPKYSWIADPVDAHE